MSTDPTQALLLALASGDASATSQAITGLVDPADPMSALLTQLISAQSTGDASRQPDLDAAWPAPFEPALIDAELEELRRRNDQLAAALGACYLCWGENPECPVCGGRGVAGAMAPDPGYFNLYVAPVLHRHRRKSEPRSGLAHRSAIEQRR